MIMLKAATPAALQDYRDGIELLASRYPSRWGQIAEADHHCRWSQWDRMMEEGLNARPVPTRRQEDGWNAIIAESAFQYACRGPLAAWWEKNLTWGFDHPTPGAAQASPTPPVQLALQAPQPQLAIQNGGGAKGNKGGGGKGGRGQGRDANPTPTSTRNACYNCLSTGHPWWDCTSVTGKALNPELKRALAAWNSEHAGKGDGRKGKGGRGGKGGKGGKSGGSPTEETPPPAGRRVVPACSRGGGRRSRPRRPAQAPPLKCCGVARVWGARVHGRTPNAGCAGAGCPRAAGTYPLGFHLSQSFLLPRAGSAWETA